MKRSSENNPNEIPKHIKKKPSSISKAGQKSAHKHDYADCLLIEENEHHSPHKARYCTICGKLDDVKFFEGEKTDDGNYRMLTDNEILERYKDLPTFHVHDIFSKYVTL